MIVKSPTADLSWTKGAKRLMANMDRFREMMMEFSHHQEVGVLERTLCKPMYMYTVQYVFKFIILLVDQTLIHLQWEGLARCLNVHVHVCWFFMLKCEK